MSDRFAETYNAQKPIWLARLARCEKTADVMEVIHEFVRAHRELWSSLPTDCQPPPFTVVEDVSRYALALYQRDLGGDRRMAKNVRALASFFSEAAHRNATLMAANSPMVLRKVFFDNNP